MRGELCCPLWISAENMKDLEGPRMVYRDNLVELSLHLNSATGCWFLFCFSSSYSSSARAPKSWKWTVFVHARLEVKNVVCLERFEIFPTAICEGVCNVFPSFSYVFPSLPSEQSCKKRVKEKNADIQSYQPMSPYDKVPLECDNVFLHLLRSRFFCKFCQILHLPQEVKLDGKDSHGLFLNIFDTYDTRVN